MRIKRIRGCCLSILFCCFVLGILFLFAVIGGFCDFRFETYRQWYDANWRFAHGRNKQWDMPMPHPDSFYDAQNVIFQRYTGNFFGEEACILIADYDAEIYEQRKHELDQNLVFQTQNIEQGKDKPIIEPEFMMDGFNMRFVKLGEQPYNLEFPEEMCFVGTADENHDIVYIYYDDLNLDCVSKPFEIELPEMIRWSSVRWQQSIPLLKKMMIPVWR